MATKIVTKNSSTASAVPTASDLVQGELAVNVADKRLFTEDNGGSIVELGTNPSTLTVTGEITANGGIALGDNDKATFGDSDDLQIYHDGVNSYIADVGAGDLNISAGNDLRLQDSNGLSYFKGGENGASKIYYAGAEKLATTSTGIDVTGTATMDGLTVANSTTNAYKAAIVESAHPTTDAGLLFIGGGDYEFGLQQPYNAAGLFFYDRTNNVERMRISSAGNVGIGTSSPSDELHVKSPDPFVTVESNSTGNNGFRANNDSGNFYFGIDNAGGNFYGSAYARAIYADGAYPVTFYTNAAERMRIDSDGDMIMKGGRIKVRENDDGNDAVVITRDADEGYVNLYSSGSQTVEIRGNGDSYFNGGNVGIGTSSPTAKLTVSGTGVGAAIDWTNTTASTGRSYRWVSLNNGTGFAIEDLTAGSERMRIDSSGNLLVGTTDSATTRVSATTGGGHVFQPNDFVVFSRQSTTASQPVVVLNDTGVDGELLQFRKDGTTVGSIGVNAGSIAFGQSNTAIGAFNTDRILFPATASGVVQNAQIDLGYANGRFKDLYLSGGVYLGGTGSANKLDDYEEGTWTPSFSGAGSPSYTTQFGRYTKIGRVVYCSIAMRATSVSGSSNIEIAGLPFAPSEASDAGQRSTYSPFLGGHCSGLSESTGRFRILTNTNMAGVKGSTTTTFMTAAEFSSGGSPEITGDFWYYTS